MTTFSNLETTIGNNHNSNANDILKTRRLFKEIGIKAGEEDRPLIDKPLDNAIRTFQRELGLKEDGKMNPKGETEQALNVALAVKEKLPPKPKTKPETPLGRQQKKEDTKERLKKRWEDIRDVLKLAGRGPLSRLLFPLEMTLEQMEKTKQEDNET